MFLKDVYQIVFWPADDINAAFARIKAAIDTLLENEEMKIFAKTMIFYYSLSGRLLSWTCNNRKLPGLYCPGNHNPAGVKRQRIILWQSSI